MDLGIKDKVTFITGASSGIGLSTAEAFVKEGARVIICGRNKEKLEEAKIFFTDTVKAKNHLNFIHNNLSNWWDNEETVKVKNFFKEKYARLDTDKKKIEKFYDLINKVNKNVY